jgi:PKD repeat protein
MKYKIFSLICIILMFHHGNNAQTIDEWAQDGKLIFQFRAELNVNLPMFNRNQVDFHSSSYFLPLISEFGITSVTRLHPDISDEKLNNTYQVEFEKIEKIRELTGIFNSFDEVEYAEPKSLHKLFLTPNDQNYNNTNQWNLFKINAAQAWDISTGSTSIIVAVTDNAIYTSHPDLIGKLVSGWDVANNDNNPNPAGGNDGSHGTHVAGIVGANTNNSIGVASIGYNTSVMPVKIGSDSDGSLIAGYEGIIWAANNGADVINMSWGGGSYSSYGQNVINNAYNQGCIIVAAAGNDGVETVFYPAGYNNVIAVASTNSNDAKSSFSQYGNWITVSAPGSNILSTVPNTSYQNKSGTSMASPLVAGLVGLMKSVNPALPQADLINCLTSTCDNINAANPGYIGKLGAGRINAYAAMQCMQSTMLNFDAGIVQINTPNGTFCQLAVSPVVIMKNFGMTTLTTVTIRFQIDAEPIQTFQWTGNLATGQTVSVTLPLQNLTTGGHTFRAFTENPNNNPDENLTNDEKNSTFTVFEQGFPLPFTETFESNTFSTNNWTILNPDGSTTWDIAAVSGTTPGNKAARMNFYNYPLTGQRDAMITPPLNFSGYSTAELTFQHAYRRYSTNVSDSLIIYISTDCGTTYQRLLALGENGTGIFATGYTSTSAFVPASANDWCSGPVGSACKTINLTPYAGHDKVVIKFESFNNYSNNLYIDNINITGIPITTPPAVQFSTSATSICANGTISYTDQSNPAVLSRLWNFIGGNPSSSVNIQETVTYNLPGVYDVSLEATNAFGTTTQNFPGYITVHPYPAVQNIQQNGSLLSVVLQSGESVLWYRNGNQISGANQPIFQVMQIGAYKARITSLHGCSVFTDEVNVNPTGFDQFESATNSMFIFPNPADDEIFIFLETIVMNNTVLDITDITGKKIAEHSIGAGDQKLRLNISSLPMGTYFVRLKSNNHCNTERLMIVR